MTDTWTMMVDPCEQTRWILRDCEMQLLGRFDTSGDRNSCTCQSASRNVALRSWQASILSFDVTHHTKDSATWWWKLKVESWNPPIPDPDPTEYTYRLIWSDILCNQCHVVLHCCVRLQLHNFALFLEFERTKPVAGSSVTYMWQPSANQWVGQ